ncbi:MAG: exodeoxyribonuclease III [Polyangiaceae bacterium]|nr:exodeoxyribonuclease III [Polyangiaceae bacterium]MCW5790499.1 exodeoxyribonuclease III [Polyangiaceae bacterium]
MKIATWNVNSLRVRLTQLIAWLDRHEPDVVCLQETKVVDEDFPSEELQRAGYGVAFCGQKTYNGVAILSSRLLKDVQIGLAAPPDAPAPKYHEEPRLIAATVRGVRVYSAYVPNGKGVNHPDFAKKLAWLTDLRRTVARDVEAGLAPKGIAVCGDYNIAPEARDVHDPEAMQGQLHFHPDEHAALKQLMSLGLVDAYRLHHQAGGDYSWWDYRMGAFRRNHGLRIDLILLSESLAERCLTATIDRDARALPQPSDHAPVLAELRLD